MGLKKYRYRHFLSAKTMEELTLMIRFLPVTHSIDGSVFFAKGLFYISVNGSDSLNKEKLNALTQLALKNLRRSE